MIDSTTTKAASKPRFSLPTRPIPTSTIVDGFGTATNARETSLPTCSRANEASGRMESALRNHGGKLAFKRSPLGGAELRRKFLRAILEDVTRER